MNISEAGLAFIRSYEGYAKELKDGSGRCTAYQEKINGKLDVPTIGYGCTKGVTMGMVWTRDEAEAALGREIAIHEKRVSRLVTVELSQGEYDCLASFDFNSGGLTDANGKPTGVLRAINSGDRSKTIDELRRWNKFGGKVCDGLVARRAGEIALFLTPSAGVAPDFMPQAPEQARRKLTPTEIAAGTAAGLGTLKAGVEQAKEAKVTMQDARALVPPVPKSPDLFLYGGALFLVAAVAFLILHKRSA